MTTNRDARLARLEAVRDSASTVTRELDANGKEWVHMDHYRRGECVSRVSLPCNGRGDGPKAADPR